jgi:hypothetical protein
LATCTDEKWLISPGKKIVGQKRYMSLICLRGAHNPETGKRLAMVTATAAAFMLRTV